MLTKAFQFFLHVLIWPAVYLLPYLVTYGSISTVTLFREPGSLIHIASTVLLIMYAYLNHYVLVPRLYLHRNYFAYAVFVMACVLVVIWLPNIFRIFEDNGPPAFPPPHGEHHHNGGPPLGVSKLSYNIILFVICTFVSISIRQQRQLLEMQKEKLNAELSFLKAQINPHFLFNTLNSIYALSIRKSDDTPKAIIQLSELMRYLVKDSDSDTVPLHRELAYISNYVALQKQRLGNTVHITYSASDSIADRRIAPLILMSFVENAFKHGVNPDQDSAIHISIGLKEDQLYLLVVNNKVTAINREEAIGIGLKNATSRLEHLYPGKHKLTIENGEKIFLYILYSNYMIKAIALDDEPPALDIIESFCSLTEAIELVKTFTRSEDALKYLLQFPVDLLFLDINMPSISGLDFKKNIDPTMMVIFTTAYSEYAVEGFNLNAVDYLLKPFTPERFLQSVEKAKAYYGFLHQNALAKPDHISVRVDYALVKVPLADILFIEGLDDYLKIHLQGQKPLVSRMTMKAILEKLPQSDFVRVHRSYIVPLAKIEVVRNKIIWISGEEIPIGTSYESRFYEVFGK